jgi:hypothetical protein
LAVALRGEKRAGLLPDEGLAALLVVAESLIVFLKQPRE